jgi:hypothetical protein
MARKTGLQSRNIAIINIVKKNQPCGAQFVADTIQWDYDKTLRRLYHLGDREFLQVNKGLFSIFDGSQPKRRKPRYVPPVTTKPQLDMYVYLFQYAGYFKIGITKDVAMRQRKIQAYIPEELIIVHSTPCENARAVELSLHERYAHRRVRGEWFKLDFCEVQEIVTLLSIDSQVAVES